MIPPHTRGWTLHWRSLVSQSGDSPAHAGMDPDAAIVGRDGRGFPRTRGDGPEDSGNGACMRPIPPHTRGWTAYLCDAGEKAAEAEGDIVKAYPRKGEKAAERGGE